MCPPADKAPWSHPANSFLPDAVRQALFQVIRIGIRLLLLCAEPTVSHLEMQGVRQVNIGGRKQEASFICPDSIKPLARSLSKYSLHVGPAF